MEQPHTIPPVSSGEMAFALDLFVSVVTQRFVPGTPGSSEDADPQPEERHCEALYDQFHGAISAFPPARQVPRPGELTLRTAFRRICVFFADHADQFALCARVLAFYLLSERTAGAFLQGLSQPNASDPRFLMLDARVISAMASIPLSSSLSISADGFLSWLRSQSPEST